MKKDLEVPVAPAVNLSSIFTYRGLKFLKSKEMFSFSIESLLIAHFIKFRSDTKLVLDIGTNNALIPLIISKISQAQVIGIEIQPSACRLAEQNVALNNMQDRIQIIEGDVRSFRNSNRKLPLIVCNPPFFSLDDRYRKQRINQALRRARHEANLTLDELLAVVRKLINNRGYFVLCHCVDRLVEVLTKCRALDLTPKRIRFIHAFADREAKTFLLETRFQANPGLIVEPPIICHNPDSSFRAEIQDLYTGQT